MSITSPPLSHRNVPPPGRIGCRVSPTTDSGFSLLELLVVLTVAAILLGTTISAFQSQRAKNDVKKGAEEVLALLRQAAAEAPLRDQPMTVSVESAGSPWCVGVAVNSACNCLEPDECTVDVAGQDVTRIVTGADHPGIVIADTFSGNSTTFEPVRGRASSPGTLSVSSGDWSLDVRVSTEGRLQVCNPANNAIPGYEAC